METRTEQLPEPKTGVVVKRPRRRANHDGTVYRRPDGRWAASVSAGRVNGRRYRPTVYGRTRAEAQVKLRRLRLDLHLGNAAEAHKTKLSDYMEAWLDSAVSRETSRDLYETLKRLHIDPYIGMLTLTKLTPTAIRHYLATLARRKVTPSVRRHAYDTLRWALSRAVAEGLLPKNPASCVPAPEVTRRQMACLNEQQLRAFLVAAKEDRYHALYVLASYGLRQGELFGLTDHDIEYQAGELHIRQSLHLVRGKRSLGALKTSSSERTLKLAPAALRAVRDHLARLEAEGWTAKQRLFPLADGRRVPLMFVNTRGQPLHRPAVRQHSFKRILLRAGLPDIRFHDLRHTAASLMLHKGFGILAVSKWLGHSKPSTTLNLYGHLLVDDRAMMAEQLDLLLLD